MWLRPHEPELLQRDPLDTERDADVYYQHWTLGAPELKRRVAEQRRAIEHEQALLRGMEHGLAALAVRSREHSR